MGTCFMCFPAIVVLVKFCRYGTTPGQDTIVRANLLKKEGIVQEHLITSLDIGSRKFAGVMALIDRENQMRILAASQVPARGVKRGGITNIEDVSQGMVELTERVEQLGNHKFSHIYLGMTGKHIESYNHTGAVAVSPPERDISFDDVTRVIDVAGSVPLENNRSILAVIPRTYIIDGQDGIKNPVGMSGHRLEVEALIISGVSSLQQNLVKCANAAHLQVDDIVVSALASAEAVLAPSEREMGVIMIDIGAGTSDVAMFVEGGPLRTFSLEMGGNLISDDIAYALRLPSQVAESIKVSYGSTFYPPIPEDDMIDLNTFMSDCHEVLPRRILAEKIIYPRVEEMLTTIRDEIRRTLRDRMHVSGVVLTGGSAQLTGIAEVTARIFEAPVRIGAPHSLYGASDAVLNPAFSTAIGLLRWQQQAIAQGMFEDTRKRFSMKNILQFLGIKR